MRAFSTEKNGLGWPHNLQSIHLNLFSPMKYSLQPSVCGSISKCQSWLIERIAIYCVSPAFCVIDRGTWDKHAALVELAFFPFNRGWHFYCSECRAKLHRYEKMVSLCSLLKKQLWKLHNSHCRACSLIGVMAFIYSICPKCHWFMSVCVCVCMRMCESKNRGE